MTEPKQYAEGGFISTPPGGDQTFRVSPGHALMSLASYRALGRDGAKEMLPNLKIELVISAKDIKELGPEGVMKIVREVNEL